MKKITTTPEHSLVVKYDPAADLCYIPEPIASYTVKKSGLKAIWAVANQSGRAVTLSLADWRDKATGNPASPFVQPPPYVLYVPKKTGKLKLDLRANAPVVTYKYLIDVTYLLDGDTRKWTSTDPDLIIEGSSATLPRKPSKPARTPPKTGTPSGKGKKAARKR